MNKTTNTTDLVPTDTHVPEGARMVRRHGRTRNGRYTMTLIEHVGHGDTIDGGDVDFITDVAGNDRVWDVVYMDGIRYTETRGAWVRVYHP